MKRDLFVQRQFAIPVVYESVRMKVEFRVDLIVERSVIVEIKSIETMAAVHERQVLTYLKLAGLKIGLLINFNEELLKNGITGLYNNQFK